MKEIKVNLDASLISTAILTNKMKNMDLYKKIEVKDKQKEIYNHYGLDTQLEKLEEECLELALAIKHRDKPGNDNFRNIIPEIADVLNLIEQIKDNESYFEDGIDAWKAYKVDRQLERVKND